MKSDDNLREVAQELLRELDAEGAAAADWTRDQVLTFCAKQAARERGGSGGSSGSGKDAGSEESWKDAAQAMRDDLLDPRNAGDTLRARMELGDRATRDLSSPRVAKPNTHSGYVDKRASTSWSHWNKRFFALKGDELEYYRDRADLGPRKSFGLTPETVVFPIAARKHCIEVRNLRGASRPLIIRCDDAASTEAWLTALDVSIRSLGSLQRDL